MNYIKSEDHLINYLNKAIRESGDVDANKALSAKFYIEEIYDADLADEYTWQLKQTGAHLIEEEYVLDWLAEQRESRISKLDFAHELTKEFLELSQDLETLCGVYSFWNTDSKPLYVGRSMRLGRRILSSFARFGSYDRPIYIRYIQTDSAPNAAILEIYFISLLSPPFNRQDNYAIEDCTLKIGPIPDWSERIRCNITIYENREGRDEQ